MAFWYITLSKWTGKYERFGETTTSTFHPEGRPSSLHVSSSYMVFVLEHNKTHVLRFNQTQQWPEMFAC
jgi:hypothetical protein